MPNLLKLSWADSSRYEGEKNRKAFRIGHNSNIEEKLTLAQQALDLARQTFDTAKEHINNKRADYLSK